MNSTSRLSIEKCSSLIDMKTMVNEPDALFRSLMGTLIVLGLSAKAWQHLSRKNSRPKDPNRSKKTKPSEIVSLQRRFLPVFFLFRMSFWISGPYFYQVYSSKILRHMDGTTSLASKEFVANVSLVGYLAIVVLGPPAGKLIDRYGRKNATLLTGAMYAIGSLSVFSNIPVILYSGRALGSIASSRLTSTPEAWFIGEYSSIKEKRKDEMNQPDQCWLSETFGLAYGGDALVAILAGQTASLAASSSGNPTGPFAICPLFVGVALLLVIIYWAENKGGVPSDDIKHANAGEKAKSTEDLKDNGLKVIFSDSKIVLVGLVQSLFEGSMYIFVLVWPPVFSNSIRKAFGPSAVTPFGSIFSCFMACCLLGSIISSQLRKMSVDVITIMAGILFLSTTAFSWSVHAIQTENIFAIIIAFFAFEACVGIYFPSIGIIRSQVLPESHRPVIMTLFAVPLNLLVVGVIFFHSSLDEVGALTIASFAMGIATACTFFLRWKLQQHQHQRKGEEKHFMRCINSATQLSSVHFQPRRYRAPITRGSWSSCDLGQHTKTLHGSQTRRHSSHENYLLDFSYH
mmetsp:Transcript_20012/g.43529  ORF Transcript_20012/g.43529 Transcript_20012/m.43529 type:complete len:571 (-) Transcript_20012:497-2209(-)